MKCVVKYELGEFILCSSNSKTPLTLLILSLPLQTKNSVIGKTHWGKQEANTSQMLGLRPKWRQSVGHGDTPGKEYYDLVAGLVPTALSAILKIGQIFATCRVWNNYMRYKFGMFDMVCTPSSSAMLDKCKSISFISQGVKIRRYRKTTV